MKNVWIHLNNKTARYKKTARTNYQYLQIEDSVWNQAEGGTGCSDTHKRISCVWNKE